MIAGGFAAIIALATPNYYKSTTIFYAASPDLAKPDLIFGNSQRSSEYYGSADDVDRLITIGNSNELVDHIVRTFHLFNHYGIDSTTVKGIDRVRRKFLKHYNIKKTPFDAIELSVEDRNRKLSAAMANEARERINEIAQKLIKESQGKLIRTFEYNISKKRNEIKRLSDSLVTLRTYYRIYNPDLQASEMGGKLTSLESDLINKQARLSSFESQRYSNRDTLANLRASIQSIQLQLQALKAKSTDTTSQMSMARFNEGLPIVQLIGQLLEQGRNQLSYDIEKFAHLRSAVDAEVQAVILLEEGEVPLVKSRPQRSFMVLGTMFAVFVLSVIGILLFESYKEINWRDVLSEH